MIDPEELSEYTAAIPAGTDAPRGGQPAGHWV